MIKYMCVCVCECVCVLGVTVYVYIKDIYQDQARQRALTEKAFPPPVQVHKAVSSLAPVCVCLSVCA